MMKSWCDEQIRIFLTICEEIRFPVSLEKTYFGTTILVFLGLLIDAERQIIAVPVEKIHKALDLINTVICSKKVTLKQLQKITGFFKLSR